jgi:hypothetical protein
MGGAGRPDTDMVNTRAGTEVNIEGEQQEK